MLNNSSPVPRHPDWEPEQAHLQTTLALVSQTLGESRATKENIDREVHRLMETGDPDSSIDYADLSVNLMIQGSLALRLRNLTEAARKPYFARVDFREEGQANAQAYYIGKMVLIRESDMRPVIIDWRAPVASLYYEERLGEAHYQAPRGDVRGTMSLKRQYTIEDAALRDLFDIDITTNDTFLQSYLGANADTRLKDIVSTIQAEQNRIIRADMWTPLIVQGAAGSGKTTIALHRIAYLVYTHEKTFKPEAFMIIAPNTLFLNYISEILPELGVDRVRQTTFEDFAMDLIGKRFRLRDPNEKLMIIAENRNPAWAERLAAASRLKASTRYKMLLDRFMDEVELDMLPDRDFEILDEVLLTRDELVRLFTVEYRRWPVKNRLEEIRKHMVTAVRRRKDALWARLERACADRVEAIKLSSLPETDKRLGIINAYDERDERQARLHKDIQAGITAYLSGILKPQPWDWYARFLEWLGTHAENPDEAFVSAWSLGVLAGRPLQPEGADVDAFPAKGGKAPKGTRERPAPAVGSNMDKAVRVHSIELEDLAPLIHLRYRVHGLNEKIPVRHIVIDEAQDFSAFQLDVVRRIIPDSSFTILGDLCQGIHSYRSLSDWEEIRSQVFHDRRTEVLTLEQSYRTTVEIMDAANGISARMAIPGVPLAKPVIRHGEPVRLFRHEAGYGMQSLADTLAQRLRELQSRGMKLLAVIGKTLEECRELHRCMRKHMPDLNLITGAEGEYGGGAMVVPAHLSKGLEFDGVLIANAGSDRYQDTMMDAKLLYVAMTRAMHVLDIHCVGEPSVLLGER
jgi:DNA helicase II / ATP-dependent DNA helicase PcrA